METKKTKRDTNGPKEHKKNWQEQTATVDDIRAFLDERILLRHNVVTGRVECCWPTVYPDDPPSAWEPITDRAVNSLWSEMSKQKTVRVQDMQRVIESDYVADFDPFRFYLTRLPPWNDDKDDYILELAMSVVVKGVGITQKLNTVWLGRAFVELGFQKRIYRNVRGYVVVRRSAEEMRSLQSQMAHGDDTEDTANTVIF